MKKILFYQLQPDFQNLFDNESDIIGNLIANQEIDTAREQLHFMLQPIDYQHILNLIVHECHDLPELIVSENVIHLSIKNEFFEQIVIFDYYISYEFDNDYKILYKKLQRILKDYQECNELKSKIMI